MSDPVPFRVVWGDRFHRLDQVTVWAHDDAEALALAHERRPELPRPRVALPIVVVDPGPPEAPLRT